MGIPAMLPSTTKAPAAAGACFAHEMPPSGVHSPKRPESLLGMDDQCLDDEPPTAAAQAHRIVFAQARAMGAELDAYVLEAVDFNPILRCLRMEILILLFCESKKHPRQGFS